MRCINYMFLLFITFCFFVCCEQTKGVNDYRTLVIPSETLPISEFVEPLVIRPLETNDSIQLIRSDRLFVFDKEVYILDEQQKTLFVFDTNGQFLNKLGRVGRGPDEYIMMNDFCVDESKNVMILDSYSSCCKVYDEEFNHLKDIRLPRNSFNYIQQVDDSLIVLYSMSDGAAVLYNHQHGEIVAELSISQEDLEFRTPFKANSSPFKRYKEEVYLLASARKEIYKITPSGFVLYYAFSFGEKDGNPFSLELPNEKDFLGRSAFSKKNRKTETIYSIAEYWETDEFVFLICSNFSKFLYNKNLGKWMILDKKISYQSFYGRTFYEIQSIETLHLSKRMDNISVDDIQWKNILALPADSNPILLSYKLK